MYLDAFNLKNLLFFIRTQIDRFFTRTTFQAWKRGKKIREKRINKFMRSRLIHFIFKYGSPIRCDCGQFSNWIELTHANKLIE